MSINQKQIAKLLGITQASVSLALADSPRVSAEVRAKVRELCGRYGYHPNHSARSLLSKKTGAISLLRDEIHKLETNHYWSSCLQAEVVSLGYMFRIDPIAKFAQVVAENSTDAFIVFGSPGEYYPDVLEHVRRGMHNVIFTDCIPKAMATNTVATDNRGGAASAVRHLAELGHTAIGFLGLVAHHGVNRERHAGYVQEMNNRGLSAPDWMTASFNAWPYDLPGVFAHREQVAAWFDSGVTAILACSDLAAVGAVKIAKERGLQVPQDVSVVGFDDTLLSVVYEPALTVLRQPIEEAARIAAVMAVVAAKAVGTTSYDDESPSVVLPMELLVRESTGHLSVVL